MSVSEDQIKIEVDSGAVTDIRNSVIIQEWMRRVSNGRDIRIIISADNAATGVGKTTLAVVLCLLMDIWGWGPEKATLDPREFSVNYDKYRSLSAVLLDEAEQAIDRRRAMTKENLAIANDFATKRYRQLMGVLTLPSKEMMDSRVADKLCDYWILVKEPGTAKVFELSENQFTGQVYYKHVETIQWPKLDDRKEFLAVEEKKHKRMTGQAQSRFVTREEADEKAENFWNKAEARTKWDFIKAMQKVKDDPSKNFDPTQHTMGEIAGMSQSNISKIINTDEFGEFYKSFADSAEA